jgi:hypothetical protein
MARFRKRRTVVVEAWQWFPGKDVPGVYPPAGADPRPYVMTAHGQAAYLEPGDYVLVEPDGRGHYPCKADIFEANYEPAG